MDEAPLVGRTIKHFAVEGLLGRGGMGVVYRARDTRLGRPVALKFLTEEVTSDPDRRRRFLTEARAACAVSHPAIAQIYDVDEAESGIFIAMELVEGKSVRELIQGRELDLLGALEVTVQVAGGLGKAHEAGIVHRDIKPENIVVTPDGHAKILDFGLAKLLETGANTPKPGSADEMSHMETMAKTQAGMILGTLRYMSPEQARGQKVDQRSDLFSLGIVLYEMVTGQTPFAGGTPLDTLHAIAFEETRPVTALRANVPASLQRVVSRCLRKRPEDRYADARELAGELKAVQREVESGISSKVPLGVRLKDQLRSLADLTPREWVPTVVGAAILLALLALLFVRSTGDVMPGLIMIGGGGLLAWRRFRNRQRRLVRKFVAKARKLPEVRVIAHEGRKISVVSDKALARTYVRLNAILDGVNGSMFFGEPFSMSVRDDVAADEEKALLQAPGVVYVREDGKPAGS